MGTHLCLSVLAMTSIALFAQSNSNDAGRARVYITDSKSWVIGGGGGGTSGGFGVAASGGDRPQTAEIAKTLASAART